MSEAGSPVQASDPCARPSRPAPHGTLLRYARDTWASMAAMADHDSGLPADAIEAGGTASAQTSITDIGAYMWSTLAAERIGLIDRADMVARLSATLATLSAMDRHSPSGLFYNWYDHRTGTRLTAWPPGRPARAPILSSVDNGWLATGLHVAAVMAPEVADRAMALFSGMDFGFFYHEPANQIAICRLPDSSDPPKCYDTLVSESRIATYLGIATGRLPDRAYFGSRRAFPPECCWQRKTPVGSWLAYLGVDVYEGAYEYGGTRVVPSWGGSMFEALMPALFVPEEEWGRRSWAVNHPRTVAAHIHHGLVEAGYGYWGFSSASDPAGGYSEYGVGGIATNSSGYNSKGVVAPHASFLALRYAPAEALTNLSNLEHDFPAYGEWGFRDSVDVRTGTVSGSFLSLDQGMVMAALGNALCDDMLRRAFVTEGFRRALEPVVSIEEFGV